MASFKETQMFKINKQVFDYLFILVKMTHEINELNEIKEDNLFGYSKVTCCQIMKYSLNYTKENLDKWITHIMEENSLKHSSKEIDGNQSSSGTNSGTSSLSSVSNNSGISSYCSNCIPPMSKCE